MSVFTQFANSEALIAQMKGAAAGRKGLPLGTYSGRLVLCEILPDADEPDNFEKARLHYVLQVTQAPTDPKWVGRSHHDRVPFKTFTNSDGVDTSMAAETLLKFYKGITGTKVIAADLTMDQLDAIYNKVVEVADAQASEWEFAIVENKKNPEYTNTNVKRKLS